MSPPQSIETMEPVPTIASRRRNWTAASASVSARATVDAVLQAPDLVERLRVLPADARSIDRPRRLRPGLAQVLDHSSSTRWPERAGMGAQYAPSVHKDSNLGPAV